MTATTTELELVELTAADDEPACEFFEQPCSAAATWRGIKACGHHRLACDQHHEAWSGMHYSWSYCGTCNATLLPAFVRWHRV